MRESCCTDTTDEPNFAVGQSLNGLKPLLSFISIYYPFRIFWHLNALKCSRREIFLSVGGTFSFVLAMKSNI